ncbi:MAG: GH116 family glycosyl hydrolase [Promethearchaeati archaeon SRVP18_Atabeyarchaeia-1]
MSRGCGCGKTKGSGESDCCSTVPPEKVLRSTAKPLSGIPLGGIGTGSVELRSDGRFYEWQIFNNPPWSGGALVVDWKGEEILDPDDLYFAVRVKAPSSEPKVRILASKEKSEINRLYVGSFIKNVEATEYVGEFPFVKVNYKTDLPVEVQLAAFSPFIPLDVKNSALPTAVFTFTLKNVSNEELDVSVLGGIVNAVGKGVRRSEAVNKVTQNDQFTAIEMTAKNIPQDHFQHQGSLALACLKSGQEAISYRASQYVVTDLTGSGSSGEEYWRILQTEGQLDNMDKTPPPFLATVLQSLPDLAQSVSKLGGAYMAFPKEIQKVLESGVVSNVPEFEEAVASDLTLQADPKKRWMFILEQRMRYSPAAKEQYDEMVAQRPEIEKDLREKQKFLEKIVPPPKLAISPPKLKGPQGLLCSRLSLQPSAEAKVTFLLTWFFPNHVTADGSERMGHMYENWFSSALSVAEYVVKNLKQLEGRSRVFHDALYQSYFDYWLVDAVNAQLTTFVKSSFYVKDGRFGIWEGLGCCGLQTLDVTYYGSHPVLLFFPELQKAEMRMTANLQLVPESRRYHEYFIAFPKNKKLFEEYVKRDPAILTNKAKRLRVYREIVAKTGQDATGRIPHMFPGAFNAVDAYHMIDLMPKFALLILRDYLWTGDRKYLDEMWPHVKAAMDHNLALDEHGILLPYHYDRSLTDTYIASQTYDVWDFLGYSAYVSSIWLAALKATGQMAKLMGEESYAKKMDGIYAKARGNMEKLLWNGEYYDLWHDPPSGKTNFYCMADQLSGQWFANFLKLGDILDKEHIKAALKAVYKYNFRSDAGLLNGALPEKFAGKGSETASGLGGFTSPSTQRDNPWTGTEYAVASLLIQEGFVDEGLTIVKNVYDRYQKAGLTWNHIECGGHYYRAMDIWAVLTDLGGINYDAPRHSLSFEPKVNQGNFRSVFVIPSAWGIISQTRGDGDEQTDTVTVNEGALTVNTLVIQPREGPPSVTVQKDSAVIPLKQVKHKDKILQIDLEEPVTIKQGETLQVQVNPN